MYNVDLIISISYVQHFCFDIFSTFTVGKVGF